MRKIKNFFKQVKAWAEFVRTGNTEAIFNDGQYRSGDMIPVDNPRTLVLRKKEQTARARIVHNGDDYSLLANGKTVQTYARKRDAVRGAERRGLELA